MIQQCWGVHIDVCRENVKNSSSSFRVNSDFLKIWIRADQYGIFGADAESQYVYMILEKTYLFCYQS